MRNVNSIALGIKAKSPPMMARQPLPTSLSAIAERLRQLRKASGLKPSDFCKMCGIGKTAWANYEAGTRRISIDQAMLVCDATGATLDFVYRGIGAGMNPQLLLNVQRGGPAPSRT